MKSYFSHNTFLYLFLLILIVAHLDVAAQDVILASQSDVDEFDPSTTLINGNLEIGNQSTPSNITLLSNLSNIKNISGYLKIVYNEDLVNIDGLSSITTVGGDIEIFGNNKLTNIDGLSNLASIGTDLRIDYNDNLNNLDALSSLTTIEGNLIIGSNNTLTQINGLSNLTAIGGKLSIGFMDNLINLDGLSNLTYVGGDTYLGYNDNLANLDGLSNLTSVGGFLEVRDSETLTNVDGLINVSSVGGDFLIIYNMNLVDCCGIHNLLENQATAIGGEIHIYNNPSECSSEEDVASANCITSTTKIDFADLKTYPNPFYNIFQVESSFDYDSYEIIDFNGKSVINGRNNQLKSELQIDMSDYPEGVYYLKLFFEGGIRYVKIVKI